MFDRRKVRELLINEPKLKEMLMGVPQVEENDLE